MANIAHTDNELVNKANVIHHVLVIWYDFPCSHVRKQAFRLSKPALAGLVWVAKINILL